MMTKKICRNWRTLHTKLCLKQDTFFEFSSAFKTFWDLKNYVGFAQNKVPIFISFHRLWGGPPSLPLWGDVVYGWPLKSLNFLTTLKKLHDLKKLPTYKFSFNTIFSRFNLKYDLLYVFPSDGVLFDIVLWELFLASVLQHFWDDFHIINITAFKSNYNGAFL